MTGAQSIPQNFTKRWSEQILSRIKIEDWISSRHDHLASLWDGQKRIRLGVLGKMSNHMWGTFGSAVFAKFGTLCQLFFKLYNTKSYISINYMEYRSSGYLRPSFRSRFFCLHEEMRGRELLMYNWEFGKSMWSDKIESEKLCGSESWLVRPLAFVSRCYYEGIFEELQANRNYQNYTHYQKNPPEATSLSSI